ncbi:asparagine synthase-related protein [Sphingobium yanoikuyae]|uniref:asparagine synthase (glutamine-hydrolyzing) n=1 Tax=Sphingobium yanoikuyae TaxID=13690 RepID=A0A3G2UQ00_SPHYA|nr:asparagine synthase-related protein [Sphingobium yanoikuyae]AYO77280.1 hypothetical protein EBF16_10500 [Sphingobium yanoikuyae]
MTDFLLRVPAHPEIEAAPIIVEVLAREGFAEVKLAGAVRLFVRGAAVRSADGRMHILGDAYDEAGQPIKPPRLDDLGNVTDGIARLAARVWGQFVALRHDDRTVELYRDPSSGQPCYICRTKDAFYAASSVDLLRRVTDTAFDICRDGIIRALAYRDLRQDRTALRPVEELPPGAAACSASGGFSYIWQPLKGVNARPMPGNEIDYQLKAALLSAVKAQATGARRIMLELSGGLDSSLLALLLAELDIDFAAVTYFSHHRGEDEGGFARAVCASLGRPWCGKELHARDLRLHESAAAHLAWPSARLFTQLFDRLARDAMSELGCDRILSGGGGDGTFCYLQSSAPLLDCLGNWRTFTQSANVARDLAMAHDTTIFEVGWRALRRLGLPRRLTWKRDPSFLSRDLRWSLSRRAKHSGMDVAWAPRGKCDHLKQMLGIHNHFDAYHSPRREALRFPLASRPVIEAALQIPTWQWFEGGSNRAPVRRIATGLLPDEISSRRSKGGFDGIILDNFLERSGEMKAHLHDGWLASEKIIDVEAVDEEFRRFQETGSGRINRLMMLWDVEMWVRAADRRKLPSLAQPA